MGFYPVCPGSNQYVMGAPLFKKITLQLENGNTFEINAPDNSSSNLYIKNGNLNGKEFNKNWLNHSTIINGGKLFLKMDSVANKKRGISKQDKPFSMSLKTN